MDLVCGRDKIYAGTFTSLSYPSCFVDVNLRGLAVMANNGVPGKLDVVK